MVDLKIDTGKRAHIYRVPERFDELSREQFVAVARQMLRASQGLPPQDGFYISLLGMEDEVWQTLSPAQRYPLKSLLDFTTNSKPHITQQLVPFLEVGGSQLIGYQPTFSNTTWQEFIYADGYFMNGRFKEAVAVLYRPQREPYTGETDRRVPFTIYGTDSRLPLFDSLDEAELLAAVLNYQALRRTYLEAKYTKIFGSGTAKPKSSGSAFSWVSVHRNLMGDQFYDEQKFFDSNVHVILHRMNHVLENAKSHG